MKKVQNTDVNIEMLNKEVELYGWVNKKRNLGGLIFIDLRDRSGIVQVVVNPDNDNYEVASTLKNEYVIKVVGKVLKRENVNPNLKTGEIEIEADKLEIINASIETPFEISDNTTALEDTRLKYRYLDLRRVSLKNKILIRHQITKCIRNFLDNEGFIDIETPILCRSTPEGARDYLVPSRVNNGSFYALPQSPQILKQLLMISGFEKYYQIAKCFRDEDLRADRQPEFTQIDMEMSFVEEEDVINTVEGLLKKIMKDVKGIDMPDFPRMTYNDAMNYYGSDKPDTRFEMKLQDLTEILRGTSMNVFNNVIENGGVVKCLVVKNNGDKYSRSDVEHLTDFVKIYGAKGLAWLKYDNDMFNGVIAKNLEDDKLARMKDELDISNNDLILIVADKPKIVHAALGNLRLNIAKRLDLIPKDTFNFLWVTDFPAFEWSDTENRFMATHHPFTMPKDEDVDKLLTDKANVYSKAYDIVLNGYEAGGGSIRIHNQNVQQKMFEALELTEEQIKTKFGFFVDALKYGTPPHGGLALGLDRLTMILCDTENIKDVIAFPKTQSAACLMSEAPGDITDVQLKELGIKLDCEEK